MRGSFYIFLPIILLYATNVDAQEEGPNTKPQQQTLQKDTLELNGQGLIGTDVRISASGDTVLITSEQSERKIPRKAALYAAALPGLGQAYNGSYWKIPLVYGTFIGLGWVATYNNDLYQVYRRANIALNNQLPEQNPLSNTPNGSVPRRVSLAVESARRDRDFIYILIAGAYALQIMEAITDSHLIEFDVNDELSLEFRPTAGQLMAYGSQATFIPATGLSLFIKIQ